MNQYGTPPNPKEPSPAPPPPKSDPIPPELPQPEVPEDVPSPYHIRRDRRLEERRPS